MYILTTIELPINYSKDSLDPLHIIDAWTSWSNYDLKKPVEQVGNCTKNQGHLSSDGNWWVRLIDIIEAWLTH